MKPTSEKHLEELTGLYSVGTAVSLRNYFATAWKRRHFALAIPSEKIRTRHQHTLLGNLWNLLNPMLSAGIYFLIFAVILNADLGIDNYILWLVTGLFAYRLTSATVAQGATSVTANEGLIRSLRFPRILLPVASTLGELLTFGFEFCVLVGFAIATGERMTWRALLLPLVLAVHTIFNLGFALIAARLNDGFRDVEKLIPFIFHVLRYLSGVMVPLARFEEKSSPVLFQVLSLNPLAGILDMYRWAFTGELGGLSQLEITRTIVVSVMILFIGVKFFVSAENRYGRP